MLPSQDQQSKPLISIIDGKKVGEIKDLYLDATAAKVVAVYLGKEGIINRKTLALGRERVQVFGIDAWLVTTSEGVVELDELPSADTFRLASDFRGREIFTEGGTRLASVADVLLDREARVLGFSLAKVYVEGPLAERKAIARAAITDLGSKDRPMMTVLAQAEDTALIAF